MANTIFLRGSEYWKMLEQNGKGSLTAEWVGWKFGDLNFKSIAYTENWNDDTRQLLGTHGPSLLHKGAVNKVLDARGKGV